MTLNRYRGLQSGGPEKLGETPLADGHVTRVMRISGPAAAVDAFAALTARERGVMVASVVPSSRAITPAP